MMMKLFLCVTTACTLALSTRAHADTIRVPADVPDLREAANMALDGDEILLADGTYTGPENNVFLHDRAITIRSESGNPEACIIGDNSFNAEVFNIRRDEAGLTRIEDLTIRGRVQIGRNNNFILNICKSVIKNCIFRGDRSTVIVEGEEANPTVADCLFIEEQAGSSLITRRHAHPKIVNCRFIGNKGGNSGACEVVDMSAATFYNCEFIGNRVDTFVGAIWIRFTSRANLINCTFVGNRGGGGYGAIMVGQGNTGDNVLNVHNCIFWDNARFNVIDESSQIRVDTNDALPSTLNISYTTLTQWSGSLGGIGNNGDDPLLADADGADDVLGTVDDDVRPTAGSPAIDSGENDAFECIPVDLDGEARFEDDTNTTDTGAGVAPIIDRGAYEFGTAVAASIDDCNMNWIDDACEIADGALPDCNNNGVPDNCDTSTGASDDCNGNFIPDTCELDAGTSFDCNNNGVLDECDLRDMTSFDCNENDVPDECDIANNDSNDVNSNVIPDECEPDCNNNDTPDDWDVFTNSSPDCNGNNIPDECDLLPMLEQIAFETMPLVPDWTNNCDSCASGDIDLPWPVTISGQTFVAFEMDANGYVELLKDGEDSYDFGYGSVDELTEEDDPDHTYLMAAYDDLSTDEAGSFGYEIQEDRVVFYWYTETYDDSGNDLLNHFQIVLYADGRVQWNFILADFVDFDEDLFSGIYLGGDDTRLEEIARETIPEQESWLFAEKGNDCNGNQIPDSCDIDSGLSLDCNNNGIPDDCDIASGTSTDCNGNGIPDECEPALTDCDNDGELDVCEADTDGDGVPDDCDACEGADDAVDADGDGMPDACDACPNDAVKMAPGACGCGVADIDSDGDGVPDCFDQCPNDPQKIAEGACGCGNSDDDTDGDGVPDCITLPETQETPDDDMSMCGMGTGMGMAASLLSVVGLRGRRARRRPRHASSTQV